MLNISQSKEDGKTLVALAGRLDTVTSPQLEEALRACLSDGEALVLDLEGLDYISSAGLRVLLAAQKAKARSGGMTLRHVNETIMEIFEVTGFAEILTIE